MEIFLYVLMLCNYDTEKCTVPGGMHSPIFSNQRQCEADADLMNRGFRSLPANSFDRKVYPSCFKKTANGLTETIFDRGYKEKAYRTGEPYKPSPID